MRVISHREFRTWVAWKDDQWNNPTRGDYYLMQIAGYIAHVLSKSTSWNIKKFKIPFKVGKPSMGDVAQQTEASKAVWRARANREGGRKNRGYGRRS